MEGGRWKVEGGRWKVEGGRWKVEGGQMEDGTKYNRMARSRPRTFKIHGNLNNQSFHR